MTKFKTSVTKCILTAFRAANLSLVILRSVYNPTDSFKGRIAPQKHQIVCGRRRRLHTHWALTLSDTHTPKINTPFGWQRQTNWAHTHTHTQFQRGKRTREQLFLPSSNQDTDTKLARQIIIAE
jgi:hypothetical protein